MHSLLSTGEEASANAPAWLRREQKTAADYCMRQAAGCRLQAVTPGPQPSICRAQQQRMPKRPTAWQQAKPQPDAAHPPAVTRASGTDQMRGSTRKPTTASSGDPLLTASCRRQAAGLSDYVSS